MASYFKNLIDKYFHTEDQISLSILLVFIGIIVIFFGSILTPLFISALVAYLLNSVVTAAERWGFSRPIGLTISITLFFALYLSLFLIFPLLSRQIIGLVNELPRIVENLEDILVNFFNDYPEFFTSEQIENLSVTVTSSLPNILEQTLLQLNAGFSAAMSALIYLVLIPFLVFFFLKDKKQMLEYVAYFLPSDKSSASKIWIELDSQLFKYLRGKGLELIIVGIVTTTAFSILGANYSLLLGILVGLSVLIPLFGAIFVTIPVAIVGYFQWGLDMNYLIFLATYLIIQALDGNVLFPLLIGREVNLHPVLIVLAILIFGGIWGFWGVLLAVPLATAIRAVIKSWPAVNN